MSVQAMAEQQQSTKVELGKKWTRNGLTSVAEAARVLDLLFGESPCGGVLLLDDAHIPQAYYLPSKGVESFDPADVLAAGQPFGTAAAVLWAGCIDGPTALQFAALAGLVESLHGQWQVLDIVVRPVGLAARSIRSMYPCPIPYLGGFQIENRQVPSLMCLPDFTRASWAL